MTNDVAVAFVFSSFLHPVQVSLGKPQAFHTRFSINQSSDGTSYARSVSDGSYRRTTDYYLGSLIGSVVRAVIALGKYAPSIMLDGGACITII